MRRNLPVAGERHRKFVSRLSCADHRADEDGEREREVTLIIERCVARSFVVAAQLDPFWRRLAEPRKIG